MAEKAKLFYFGVFILVVFAFIFHVVAMGYPHWKQADARNYTIGNTYNLNRTTIGLFTRCIPSDAYKEETCFPNLFPKNANCSVQGDCLTRPSNPSCSCDFLPSTKGIAACAIIAAIFLGLAIIILFIHSVNTSETRSLGLFLGLFPLLLLLLALIFILITLILVGSYLSRDVMEILSDYTYPSMYILKANIKLNLLLNQTKTRYISKTVTFIKRLSLSLFFELN
jgi:hypothetical protein